MLFWTRSLFILCKYHQYANIHIHTYKYLYSIRQENKEGYLRVRKNGYQLKNAGLSLDRKQKNW